MTGTGSGSTVAVAPNSRLARRARALPARPTRSRLRQSWVSRRLRSSPATITMITTTRTTTRTTTITTTTVTTTVTTIAITATAATDTTATAGIRAGPSAANQRTGRRNYCSIPARGHVEVYKQRSSSPCTYGRSWGVSGDRVWVEDGCRAEFAVYLSQATRSALEPWSGLVSGSAGRQVRKVRISARGQPLYFSRTTRARPEHCPCHRFKPSGGRSPPAPAHSRSWRLPPWRWHRRTPPVGRRGSRPARRGHGWPEWSAQTAVQLPRAAADHQRVGQLVRSLSSGSRFARTPGVE